MAPRKDYANTRRKRPANASQPQKRTTQTKAKAQSTPKKPLPLKLLTVTVLMAGALGYLLYSLLQVTPSTTPPPAASAKPVTAPKPQQAEVKKAETKAETNTAQAQDKRFEFYQILPKSEVTTSDPSQYKSTPKDAKSEQTYLLQAGSFRSPEDADRMRAQLILLGLPNVRSEKTINEKGETWYRVRTGPFDNRVALKKAHDKLATQNIFPLKIRAN